jgi:hypothetical protein
MAENTGTTAETADATTPEGFKSPESKEAVLADLAKEREARKAAEKAAKENRSAAQKLAELEESQKTEQQKLADQLAAVTAERDAAHGQLLRHRVAVAKGLTADLVDRLRGDTEDELSADADQLLALVSKKDDSETRPGPRPDLSQGAQGGAGTSTAQQFAAAIGGEFTT